MKTVDSVYISLIFSDDQKDLSFSYQCTTNTKQLYFYRSTNRIVQTNRKFYLNFKIFLTVITSVIFNFINGYEYNKIINN